MITLDTSAVVALLHRKDPDHDRMREAFLEAAPPYLIPVAILSEITYFLETRSGPRVLDAFLADLEEEAFSLDCGTAALPRIRALVERYADLPLGFADASVIACAERHGGAVLTLDERHFGVVAREGNLAVLPSTS